MADQIFAEEGLEIVPIDGDTANGKNSLGQELFDIARARGEDVVLLDQDRFNFPHALRMLLWKALAGALTREERGSLPATVRDAAAGEEFLGDPEMLDWANFLGTLRRISDFAASSEESLELGIGDLFARGKDDRETLRFTLTHRTKVLLIGKYLHHRPETEALYSRRLRYRVEADPDVIWSRYKERTRRSYGHSNAELGLMEQYYLLGMRPSFDRYRARTERRVTHRVLLDAAPYELIPAKGSGPYGDELEEILKDPAMTGGVTKRWRYITGEGDTYDALVVDAIPHELVPELAGGLAPLLDRLEQEANADGLGWTWVDGAGGIGNALKEARARYPRLRPLLVDAVDWREGDFPAQVAQGLARQAEERGVPALWDKGALNFIRSDLSRAAVESPPDAPARLITVFQALGYTDDPLGIVVNLYNQLAADGYLLTNMYIPTEHPAAGKLLALYARFIEDLRAHGIPVDCKILDQRTDPLPVQKRAPGYPQYHIGMVIRKEQTSPGAMVLRLAPGEPEPYAMQWKSRRGQYTVVRYDGNLAKPCLYFPSTGAGPTLARRLGETPRDSRILALETGSTWIRAALVDSQRGRVLAALPDERIADPGSEQVVLDLMEGRAARLLSIAGLTRDEVGGVALSTAGDLDEKTGEVRLQKRLPFTGKNLRELAAERLGMPAVVLNDTVAGAWAEALHGAGRGRPTTAYLTVSTGTNAAYRTAGGKAVDLRLWEYPAPAGGTVEESTAGAHLARLSRLRIEETGGERILELAGGSAEEIRGEHIAHAFYEGNPLAVSLIEEAARVLGGAIAEATERMAAAGDTQPGERVLWVIGGGTTQGLGEGFIERIRTHAPAEAEVVLSRMPSSQRGLLGAAAKARETLPASEPKGGMEEGARRKAARGRALTALDLLSPEQAVPAGGPEVLVFTDPATFDLVPLAVRWGRAVAVNHDGPGTDALATLLAELSRQESLGPYALGTNESEEFVREFEGVVRITDRADAFLLLGLNPEDLPPVVRETIEAVGDYLAVFV